MASLRKHVIWTRKRGLWSNWRVRRAVGYSDGVEQAYATVINVSGTLRAENMYAEALKATEPVPFQSIRLQILLRMAFRLVTQQQEVASHYMKRECHVHVNT